MKIYLVGGAVRDKLLGLPVTEKDWVVVGSSHEEMLAKGYKPVGKDFPVFLHPDTAEEYALARTERKIAPGHKGFEVQANTLVSLEEDLKRRDLTVNAIAEDESGHLIDPYGGCRDLENRILRHVSDAFAEDPLRVLRAARFASRFHQQGFSIAPDTLKLLTSMVQEDLLAELPPERIWAEVNKALSSQDPHIFLDTLAAVNALDRLFPGTGHRQIDILKKTASEYLPVAERFALFLGTAASSDVREICNKLKVPKIHADLAQLIADNLEKWKDISNMGAQSLVEFIYQVDGIRRKERLTDINRLSRAIVGIQSPELAVRNHELLDKVHQLVINIDLGWLQIHRPGLTGKPPQGKSLQGKALGEAIQKTQIEEIETLVNDQTRKR